MFRLLVGVGFGPEGKFLLRSAHQMASGCSGSLLAVFVETPEVLSVEQRQIRAECLVLARELGAEVLIATGTNVGRTLFRISLERDVSVLLIGQSERISWLRFWGRDSPGDFLQRNVCPFGLLILPVRMCEAPRGTSHFPPKQSRGGYAEYLGIAAIAAAATGVGVVLEPAIGYWSVALIYLLTVTVTGVSFRRGPTLVLAAASALLWNWNFIPPKFTLRINEPQDLMMFGMFFSVALVVGHLTTRLRERERLEHRMELRATALYQLTQRLAAATSIKEVVEAVIHQIQKVFSLEAAVFLRNAAGSIEQAGLAPGGLPVSEQEKGLVKRAFESRCTVEEMPVCGKQGWLLCLPLLIAERVEGVLAARGRRGDVLDPAQRELLDAFAAQLAIVSEVQRLAQERIRNQWIADSERLQKTLFDSVSHELKTPIAAIRVALDQPMVNLEEIRRANDRLHRSVEYLLSATRIESGLIRPNPEWCDPSELAHEALSLSGGEDTFIVHIDESLPLIWADAGLTTQSLATLLENALTHGASEMRPVFCLSTHRDHLCFEVSDSGRGLPLGSEQRVFEKFYRSSAAPAGGLGLGLSIAKHFVEAQGGSILAKSDPCKGARFTLQLPLGGVPTLPE